MEHETTEIPEERKEETPDEKVGQRVMITPVDSFIVMSALAVLSKYLENEPALVLMSQRVDELGEVFSVSVGDIPLPELMSLMDMLTNAINKFEKKLEVKDDDAKQPGDDHAA